MQRIYRFMFIAIALHLVTSLLSGCSGTILSDLPGIFSAIEGGLGVLLGVLGFLTPSDATAALQKIVSAAQAELTALNTVVEQYKVNPTDDLLQKIEAGIADVTTNIQPLLAPEGVSAATAQKFAAIGQTIIEQLQAWDNIIQSLKPSTEKALVAHTALASASPLSAKLLAAKIDGIVEAPTGDPETDTAFHNAAVGRKE